jgi:hypothetical protein
MGHRYTALVAYDILDKEVSDKILALLENHSHYDLHFKDQMPTEVRENAELQKPWLFSQIAVWADVIKRRELGYSPQHRNWHYINLPIFLTDTDERYYEDNMPNNLETDFKKGEKDSWNIAQAFGYNKQEITSDKKANVALAICWIFHLMGDIHQPLHSTALFNERRFIKGDLGGNTIKVKGLGVLHRQWDGVTYTKENENWKFDEYVNFAHELRLKYEEEGLMAEKDILFEDWMNESHELAKEVGYPKELLEVIKESPIEKYGFSNPLVVKLGKDYTKQWKEQIVETSYKQITKAGYRLAYLMQNIFK